MRENKGLVKWKSHGYFLSSNCFDMINCEKRNSQEKTLEITVGIVKQYHVLKYLMFRHQYSLEAVLRSNPLRLT